MDERTSKRLFAGSPRWRWVAVLCLVAIPVTFLASPFVLFWETP